MILVKQLICALIGLTIAGAALAGEDFAFKGMTMGSSEQELLALHPTAECQDTGVAERRRCLVLGDTIADIKVTIGYKYYAGKLLGISVSIPHTDYFKVDEAIRSKYGSPNSMVRGGKFYSYQSEWMLWGADGASMFRVAPVRLNATERLTLESGWLSFTTKEGRDADRLDNKERAKAGAKDL